MLRTYFRGRLALAVTIIAAVAGQVQAEGALPDLRTTVKEVGFSDSDRAIVHFGTSRREVWA